MHKVDRTPEALELIGQIQIKSKSGQLFKVSQVGSNFHVTDGKELNVSYKDFKKAYDLACYRCHISNINFPYKRSIEQND